MRWGADRVCMDVSISIAQFWGLNKFESPHFNITSHLEGDNYMPICIVRKAVEDLHREARIALHSYAKTDEQKSELRNLIDLCKTALSHVSKSGRLETSYSQPPFFWLDKHPKIAELLEDKTGRIA
jgi:hypothetical protein